ncbi:methyltransferase domain-containing protein [Microbispora amethystogenes]|uniref:methyltransferase domain-containing protein n=1 Tax=Microbispora amethystogenes TaxID=1427754 RepID=UPI0033EA925F
MRPEEEHVAAMLAGLGDLDPEWRQALEAVPRHLFIPDRAWCAPEDGSEGFVIDRQKDPEGWFAAIYQQNAPIITQLDDGNLDIGEAGQGGVDYTSSSSAPGIVARGLDLLDPYAGDEVLEIGTGTGWTAALLAYRLGDANVTSIEIDPAVHAAAGVNLKAAGYAPHLVLGDGTEGWPQGALFNGVHVTCGVREVPRAWVEQTRPGGVIVVPWMPGWEAGHMLKLTVTGDGTAVGRFHGSCAFMLLRSQRPVLPAYSDDFRDSGTDLDPRRVVRSSFGADIAVAGLLPGVDATHTDEDDGGFHLWVWSGDSDAQVHYSPDYKRAAVHQRGPRDLWDEVEEAFLRWLGWGSPGRDRFGLTVTPEGQHVWLDRPDNVIR